MLKQNFVKWVEKWFTDNWRDNDVIMEETIIMLFMDFFEEELINSSVVFAGETCDELRSLYEYFKNLGNTRYSTVIDKEKYQIFEKNLLRVVELRDYLWT